MEQLPPTKDTDLRKPSLDICLSDFSTDELLTKTDKVAELTGLLESLISLFQENREDDEFSDLKSYLEKIKSIQDTLTNITTDISIKSLKFTTIERRDFYKPHFRQLNLAINVLGDLRSSIANHQSEQKQAETAKKIPLWLYRTKRPNSQSSD